MYSTWQSLSGTGKAMCGQAVLLNEEMLDLSHAVFRVPLGLSPRGEYGFREKPRASQLPVHKPPSGQPSPGESLYTEKKRRRTQEKETREKEDGEEERKQSRLPWRGSRGIKNKQKRVAHEVVSSESIDSFPGMTGTLCCRSLVVCTLFPTPLLCLQCTIQFHHLSLFFL